MEGRGICPAAAQAIISEGDQQNIEIDHISMLNKVMAGLGHQKPVFTVFDCGTNGFRVSIKLDVSGTRYSVGKKVHNATVESENCVSRPLAEKMAVTKAIKHLNDQHLIKIRDFSSMIVYELEGDSSFGDVNSALYSLDKMIEQWETVMKKCTSISVQLAGKDAACSDGPDAIRRLDTYADLNQFMTMTIDMFKSRVEEARARAKEIETERQKYHSRSTERYHTGLRKGYLQDVHIEPKYILDYVLTYLGAGKATYSNGPSSDGMIKGVVMFNVPEMADVGICGNLTIKGKDTTSSKAEQDAAFVALKYMERKFRLKIIDLNHAERVNTEKEQRLLLRLLEQIIDVADDVKVYWGKMAKDIATEKSAYPLTADNFGTGTAAAKKREAYKFCANCLNELDHEAAQRYADCSMRFEDMEKMQYKLENKKMTSIWSEMHLVLSYHFLKCL